MEREVPIDRNEELDRLVSEAEQGEKVVLTRDGVAVASIVAARPPQQGGAETAMDRLLSRKLRLDGLDLIALKKEGRKR